MRNNESFTPEHRWHHRHASFPLRSHIRGYSERHYALFVKTDELAATAREHHKSDLTVVCVNDMFEGVR